MVSFIQAQPDDRSIIIGQIHLDTICTECDNTVCTPLEHTHAFQKHRINVDCDE